MKDETAQEREPTQTDETEIQAEQESAAAMDADVPQPPDLLRRVQKLLGVHRLRTDQDLVRLVEDGLATNAIDELLRAGVSDFPS